MLLPLTHERMTVQRLPWITLGIVSLNIFVFLFTWPHARREQEKLQALVDDIEEFSEAHPGVAAEDFESVDALEQYKQLVARYEEFNRKSLFGRYGFVPARQEWRDILTSIFLHAGWMHLLGNMYLLWLCGCSVEDVWGRPVYVALYVGSGTVAALSHAWALPDSRAHLVGASGAIAGLMGAFLVRFGKTRIRFFYWYWIHFGTFFAPAWVVLPLWLLSQVFYASLYGDASPVAFWAHIGGFLFGSAVASFIRLSLVEDAFLAPAIEKKVTLFTQHPGVKLALDCLEDGRPQHSIPHLLTALRENAEDIDALQLLAQAYSALGRNVDAANALRRKLRAHLRRREQELAADTYFDMVDANPELALSPREALALGSVLARCGQYQEAVRLYRQMVDATAEPIFKLKAALALADLYAQDYKGQQAVEVLKSVAPLAQSLPEWKTQIQRKISTLSGTRSAEAS